MLSAVLWLCVAAQVKEAQSSEVYTRHKRELPTQDEADLMLNLHNQLRRQEGADNMIKLVRLFLY